MQTALLAAHVIITIALVGLILIQRGKGADIGAAFGSGASQTVFGSQGSASFLTRTTAILATLFFCTSLTLAYFSTQSVESSSVTDLVAPVTIDTETVPPEEDALSPTDVPLMPRQSAPQAATDDLPPVVEVPATEPEVVE